MKGIRKRGTVYYLCRTVNRKRISQSLQTENRIEAEARARAILRAIDEDRWGELKGGVRARRDESEIPATIGEILRAYELAGRARRLAHGSPVSKTISANSAQLLNLVCKALSCDRERARQHTLSALTKDLSLEFAGAMMAAAGPGEVGRVRARETVYSTLTQARSVFASWALADYAARGLVVPDSVIEWTKYKPVARPGRRYRTPPLDLLERTEGAGAELMQKGGALGLVWVLCYECGLRAGEAAAARVEWLADEGEAGFYLNVDHHGVDNPTKRDRRLRLKREVFLMLAAAAQLSETGFILPGPETRRLNLIKREFAAWMSGQGWGEYPKKAHELRKLAACRWLTKFGLEVACEWTGDAPATLMKWYAAYDPRRHPDPDAGGGLRLPGAAV